MKTGVMVMVDPREVTVGRNSRWDGVPLDPEKIESRYQSFREMGQLQACTVRKDGESLVLVLGHYRHAAALLHNERHPDEPMKLKIVVTACNSEDALMKSIAENRERHDTSPMDDAFAQKRLREEHGWDDQRIAKFYRLSPSMVSRLKNLLHLSRDLQVRVHSRELAVKAAIQLAGLSEEERTEVFAEVQAEVRQELAPVLAESNGQDVPRDDYRDALELSGPVVSRAVTRRVMDKVREKKNAKGGAVSRTLADVRRFFTDLEGKSEGELKDFAKTMLKFFAGGVGEATVAKKLKEWVK